jgi:Rps23 Pro-64 3,4-dihydroxylase Tpa1-like proline 4-hydroxylase
MNHKVLDNFIDKETCNKLISDAKKFAQNEHTKVQNDRLIIPSSSLAFLNLLQKSDTWKELHNNLNSQKFLENLMDNLKINNQNFTVTNFFFNPKPSNFLKKYKKLNSQKLSTISNLGLAFYLVYKLYRFIFRKINFYSLKKNFVELLYDYSMSPNGYYREIHRDSDSRTVVFLIYLNELNDKGTGGELNLYKYNGLNNKIPSQPSENDCTLIESIPPKAGRLVTFLNAHDSLHAVSKMENYDEFRHFIYGSFTLLSKKNDFIKQKSLGALKTNFNIFE